MKSFRLLWYLFFVVALAACTSGKRALERGEYDAAVLKAVNRLRSSPNNEKARQTLRDGYGLALEWHLENIRHLQSANVRFRWEEIAQNYDQLNMLYDEIRRCPSGLQIVGNPRQYISEATEAKMQAAIERYNAGSELMAQAKNNRIIAREAFMHFATTERYTANYRDTRARMDEARYYATLKVVVEQVTVGSRSLSISNEYFQNKINEFLNSNRRLNEFVRFYTPQEANAEKLQYPDHVVRLQFDDFVVGQTMMVSNTDQITSKDSVQVGEVTVDGKRQPVYNRVSAKLTINKKTVLSKGLLDMQIFEHNTSRVVFQNKMPGEFVWMNQWGNFNGDERALTREQKQICGTREQMPPPPQDLFVEFCKPIYSQVTEQIRRYYQNY